MKPFLLIWKSDDLVSDSDELLLQFIFFTPHEYLLFFLIKLVTCWFLPLCLTAVSLSSAICSASQGALSKVPQWSTVIWRACFQGNTSGNNSLEKVSFFSWWFYPSVSLQKLDCNIFFRSLSSIHTLKKKIVVKFEPNHF